MNPRHDGVVGCDRLDFALSSPPESDAGAARVVPLAGRGRQQGDAIGADLRRPAPAPRAPPAFLDSGMLGKRRVERTSDRGHTVLGAGLTETNHIALADRRGPRNALAVEKSAVATFQVGEQPGVAFNAQLGVAGRDDFRGITMHADRCIRLAAKTHRRAAGFRDRLTRGPIDQPQNFSPEPRRSFNWPRGVGERRSTRPRPSVSPRRSTTTPLARIPRSTMRRSGPGRRSTPSRRATP